MNTKDSLRRVAIIALALLMCICALPLAVLAESFTAAVTVNSMIVRSGPTTKDPITAYIPKGTQLTVHSYSDGIAYIEYQGRFGYALVSDMTRVNVSATPTAAAKEPARSIAGMGTVTAASLKVYASADESAKVIGTLSKGTTISVTATNGEWARLLNGTAVGYAKLSGLTIQEGVAPTPTPASAAAVPAEYYTQKYEWPNDKISEDAVVDVNSMIVRDAPNVNGKKLGTLKKGTKLILHTLYEKYAFIEYGNQFGFCLASDLKITSGISMLSCGMASVTSSSLTVYASASTTSKKLDTLKKGSSVYVSCVSGAWAQLKAGSSIGYAKVSSLNISYGSKPVETTSTPAATATPTPTAAPKWWEGKSLNLAAIVTVDKMIVRAGENVSDKLLGYVAKDTVVSILATKDDIAYIRYNQAVGFCLLSDLGEYPSQEHSPDVGTVAANSMNVYSAPDESSDIIGTYAKGHSFAVVSISGKWVTLQNGKYIGYAKAADLTIGSNGSTPTPTPTPTATPTPTVKPSDTPTAAPKWWENQNMNTKAVVMVDRMIVRSGETASDKLLCYITAGSIVTVRAMHDKIAYIRYNDSYGFCLVSDLAEYIEEKSLSGIGTVNVSSMKVYASPSNNAKVIGTYTKGRSFTVISTQNGWATLQNGKYIGYAHRSDLTITAEAPAATPTAPVNNVPTIEETCSIPAFVHTASATVYSAPSVSAASTANLAMGTEITVIGFNNAWALVTKGSSKGYMDISTLTRVSDVVLEKNTEINAVIKDSKAKVYKYASTASQLLGTLSAGAKITVEAYDSEWARVERSGSIGYCPLASLTIIGTPTLDETVRIEGAAKSASPMYTYATTSSEQMGTVPKGSLLTILGYNDSWCLAMYGSHKGYISVSNVVLFSNAVLTPNENYNATLKETATYYKYASDLSTSMGSIAKNAIVKLLAHNSEWGLIEYNSVRGYMPMSNLTIQTDEFINPTVKNQEATVVTKNVKVYQYALETATVLGSIPVATDVMITGYTSKWGRLIYEGKTGYVLLSNLSTASYNEMKTGKGSASEIIKLQNALEDLGYFDGLPAGNFGSLTTSAVQRFQKELNMDVDGVASQTLQRVLYGGHAPASPIKSTSLAKNDTGSDVVRLQNRLTYKGYMSATIDGDYGPITEKAVSIYQKVVGLPETGTADAKTMSSLFSLSAPKNNTGTVSSGTSSGGTSGSGGGSGGTGSYSTSAADDPAPGTGSDKAEIVIDWALQQLGKPYIYGKTGTASYDCSGLTYFCYKKVGITLGRSAYSCGYNSGTKVTGISNLIRGDIVCFNTLDDSDLSDHVGIYLGNYKFIHASSSAGKVVISSLKSGFYNRVFSWGRRVL